MFGRQRRGSAAADEVPEFWVVYSDLLVVLLVVFVLLLFLSLSRIEAQRKAEGERVQDVQRVLDRTNLAFSTAVRSLGDSSIQYNKNDRTMTVQDEVLFAFGSATLRPESRVLISRIGGQFARELLTDTAVAGQIDAIVVEGHTDTVGTYLSNLDLSQKRAQSVLQSLVREADDQPHAEKLRRLLVASGRSEVEAIRPGVPYDADRARRIVIRVRLRDDELIKILLDPAAVLQGRLR